MSNKLNQAKAYQRAGSLMFNLSIMIALAGIIFLLIRWQWSNLIPIEKLSDEEAKGYSIIIVLISLPLNLLSYIPLNRAKKLYRLVNKGDDVAEASAPIKNFKNTEFIESWLTPKNQQSLSEKLDSARERYPGKIVNDVGPVLSESSEEHISTARIEVSTDDIDAALERLAALDARLERVAAEVNAAAMASS